MFCDSYLVVLWDQEHQVHQGNREDPEGSGIRRRSGRVGCILGSRLGSPILAPRLMDFARLFEGS